MRVVIHDKLSGSLSVYNAWAVSVDDGYIIIGSPRLARVLPSVKVPIHGP